MNMNKPDWSTLPEYLLTLISERLHSLGDTLNFRAVCNSFRSSIPLPKPLSPPSELKIPFPQDSDLGNDGHFVLNRSTVYAIRPLTETSQSHESTKAWIVKLQKLNSGKVRVQDPLFRRHFQNLSEQLPTSLNLLDYGVKEIANAYQLAHSSNDSVHPFFRKVVVSTCHEETDDAFMVMALYDLEKLLMWRNLDQKWTRINIPYESIADLIFHNKQFYVLVGTGLIITIDSKTLTITEVAAPLQDMNFGPGYFLKSFEDLYMIGDHREYGTNFGEEVEVIVFKVYKLDEEKSEWVRMKNDGLENRAFFLDEDCSFSVMAPEFDRCEANCIYFDDDEFLSVTDKYPGLGARIYNLESGFHFLYFSSIFWPPPDWLKQHPSPAPHF